MRILLLPGSYQTASARFRVWQFVAPLQKAGCTVEVRMIKPAREWNSSARFAAWRNVQNRLGTLRRIYSVWHFAQDIENFDVVLMCRDLLPEVKITFLEPWLARRNPRLIFDFDDAIHLGARQKKLRHILPHFAWLTPGNAYLANFAREVNPRVSIWPTVIDSEAHQPPQERTPGPIRIGWSGSRSTLSYCQSLLYKIVTQLAEYETFEFILNLEVDPQIHWPGIKSRYVPWTPQTEIQGLYEMDIGLMPLQDEPFERGKCGLKAIRYMAMGIPAVVSPVGVSREIVLPGETGFHCTQDEEWLHILRRLIHDPALRARLGSQGRARVESHYSIHALLPQMLQTFQEIARSPVPQ